MHYVCAIFWHCGVDIQLIYGEKKTKTNGKVNRWFNHNEKYARFQ